MGNSFGFKHADMHERHGRTALLAMRVLLAILLLALPAHGDGVAFIQCPSGDRLAVFTVKGETTILGVRHQNKWATKVPTWSEWQRSRP